MPIMNTITRGPIKLKVDYTCSWKTRWTKQVETQERSEQTHTYSAQTDMWSAMGQARVSPTLMKEYVHASACWYVSNSVMHIVNPN